MADSAVADLDRRGTELEAALSGSNRAWDDSRRHAMDDRYLRPHAEAHSRLHSSLTSNLAALGLARVAAGNADQAVAVARRESDQASRYVTGTGCGTAQARAAAQAGLVAEASAAQRHARTVGLAEQANSIPL